MLYKKKRDVPNVEIRVIMQECVKENAKKLTLCKLINVFFLCTILNHFIQVTRWVDGVREIE